MTGVDEANQSQANILCKSCGLCCTGHLFIWTKLRSAELNSSEALGLKVFRSDPRQRGFSQPCPLWQGQCTIYNSPQYPRFCHTYKCKLLKEVLDESTSLSAALGIVEQAKGLIQEVEALLPSSAKSNFRERLVEHLESLEESSRQQNGILEFRRRAGELLALYEQVFGVDDVVEKAEE